MITKSLNVPKIYNVNQSQLLKFKKKKKFCCSSNISSLEVSIGKQISIHFTTSCGSSETGSIHLSCQIQHSPKRFFFFFFGTREAKSFDFLAISIFFHSSYWRRISFCLISNFGLGIDTILSINIVWFFKNEFVSLWFPLFQKPLLPYAFSNSGYPSE